MSGVFTILGLIYVLKLCNARDGDVVFECNFETDVCGMLNDENAVAKWERQRINVGGQDGTAMVLSTNSEKRQIGRLLTPYLEEHWRNVQGCLSFQLFTSGDGVTSFRVRRQDDSGILPLLGIHTQLSKWRMISITVDVEDYIRFVFEAHVNPSMGSTVVALDNVAFKIGECDA